MSRDVVLILVGLAVGATAVRLLTTSSDCCQAVGGAVRDRATDALGGWVGDVGDFAGVWDPLGGFVAALGLA